jgi:hypothetical protein
VRKYGRTDGTHAEIVKTLRSIGFFVQSLASVGNGCPDLLVSRCGCWHLIEVKNGNLSPSEQRLTGDETEWISRAKAPVNILHSAEEAVLWSENLNARHHD